MKKQLTINIFIPLAITIIAIISEYSGFDLYYASCFFDRELNIWPYQSAFITSELLHTGGRNFVALLAIGNLLAIGASFFCKSIGRYRKHLVFIFVAGVSGPLIVGWLKTITHIYTPWSLTLFGGNQAYIRIFDPVPAGAPVGHAFPGGHASGGFAYLSLYFLLLITNNKYRYHALVFVMILGTLFSIAQEARGAHFLSHDLFSFVICWSASLAWSLVFYRDYYTGKYFSPGPEQGIR